MGRLPAELGAGPGRVGALVEEEDFGEVIAEACPGLRVGAGDRARGAVRDGRRLGEFGDGGVLSVRR